MSDDGLRASCRAHIGTIVHLVHNSALWGKDSLFVAML